MGDYNRSRKVEREALDKCIAAFEKYDFWDVLYMGRVLTPVLKGR